MRKTFDTGWQLQRVEDDDEDLEEEDLEEEDLEEEDSDDEDDEEEEEEETTGWRVRGPLPAPPLRADGQRQFHRS